MIEISIWVDSDKLIHKYTVTGHSGYSKKGSDVVCAAVSTVFGGFMISAGNLDNIDFDSNSDSPGNLDFILKSVDQKGRSRLLDYSNFLINTLLWIESEYRDYCRLNILNIGAE